MGQILIQMVIYLSVLLSAVAASPVKSVKKAPSIDKQIIDAAPDARMFDLFHVTPDSEIMILTEFDLLLTHKQYEGLYGEDIPPDNGVIREKRKAHRNDVLYWPDCKVYYEMGHFREDELSMIKAAIEEWERYTCLSFIEEPSARSRIQFKKSTGCHSALGRQSKPQEIGLADHCFTYGKGIITHEIGHAIGWYHEHMRPDRDQYIKINLDAIPVKYKSFYEGYKKHTADKINTFGVEYDYTSLMHYGNNGLPGSITTLDPDYQDKIGQRDGLSFKDIKLANIMYNCAEDNGCKKEDCPSGGFQLYNDYKGKGKCRCWCDSGNIEDPLVLCTKKQRKVVKPRPLPVENPFINLCYDVREDCDIMKNLGFCKAKTALMMDMCRRTCNFCDVNHGNGKPLQEPCMDHDKGCEMMAMAGYCNTFGGIMEKLCPASCNKCPTPPDPCKIQEEIVVLKDMPLSEANTDGDGGASPSSAVIALLILVSVTVLVSAMAVLYLFFT